MAQSIVRVASRFLALFVLLLSLPLPAAAAADESHFPVPDNIRPAIQFWIKVYTEADTESGFLHDAQNLAVIYQKLPRDTKQIDTRRRVIASDLNVLAGGKRSDLSNAQQHLLELWGSDISNERLALAADSIRWQLGQSDRYQEGLIRSGAYRQHIESVVRAKGMPIELAALPHVESSFHPGAYSSAAASGMWQFMRETAKRFMRVDAIVDERLDPYRATYAAMDMLQADYRALGSWPLALTAYNHGANGIARAVRATGSPDIGRIIAEYKGPRFGFASRNFYPQFLAALEVERNAERYFGNIQRDAFPDFAEYELSAFVDAGVIANSLSVDLDALKRANPALLPAIWNGNKRIPKGYVLKVDRGALQGDLIAAINTIPDGEFYDAQIPDLSYTVVGGDTLSGIAGRYNTSISELVAINQLRDRHSIRIGQKLVLPQQNGMVPTLIVNNTGPQALPNSGSYTVQRETAEQAENVLATDPTDYSVAADNTIEILADETLGHFADWLGMDSATLRRLNNLRANATVRVGNRLKMDFTNVNRESFETSRKLFHSSMQAQYFASYRIRDTESYSIKRNQLVGELARERSVPMWLFRQYNPLISDASLVNTGQVVVFPVVEKVSN